MSEKWQYFVDPPPQWTAVCQASHSLFHTSAWQSLLTQSFNTAPVFALGPEEEDAFALSIFPAGPFRVGYMGFPAGGVAGGRPLTARLVNQLPSAQLPRSVHLLRLVTSPFPEPLLLDYACAETWETMIPDLQSWQDDQLLARVRRDVRKAQKSNVTIENADLSGAAFISRLYQETVRRHSGTLRYKPDYFRLLLEMAQESPDLHCWLALVEGQPVAFLTAVREGETVFYLHGAMDWEYRQHQPSDLLLYTAIHWAKEEGASQFNMMASPLDQTSLVKYKEKWGGITEKQRTYDVAVQKIPTLGFHFAMQVMKGWTRWTNQLLKSPLRS